MSFSALLKDPRTFHNEMADFMSSKERIEEGLQHLSYTNGLMTAVIVGPEVVRPNEWMRLIVDTSGQRDSNAQLAMNMLLLDYHKILTSLTTDENVYKPLYWEDENGRPVLRDWAEGFWTGLCLRREAWTRMYDDQEARVALLPILLCLENTKLRPEIEKAGVDMQELIDEALDGLPKKVQYIHDYWQKRQSDGAATFRRVREKVRRNDPCPCGSGRKYKKCCLN